MRDTSKPDGWICDSCDGINYKVERCLDCDTHRDYNKSKCTKYEYLGLRKTKKMWIKVLHIDESEFRYKKELGLFKIIKKDN